ncbi:MAG: hypothetical protein K2K45_02510 [Muribaculaceae bacterium]|nr:hypothetical protein [Muribaculaceae bacterium]
MTVSNIFRRLILTIFAVFILYPVSSLEARKIKTRHTIAKVAGNDSEKLQKGRCRVTLTADSVDFDMIIRPAVRFYGFDKTIGSSFESFFITNGLDSTIEGMEISITYFDMKGRQLHRRTTRIDCKAAAGETIRTDIKSWDIQKSFYFHRSAKPKRQATPFDVKIDLISINLSD